MPDNFDALVIGGGPGGATAALLLACADWRVALVERKSFPRRKVCGEYLSATNLPLLEQLGIADEFLRLAGPDVREVGLFAGDTVLRSRLPCPSHSRWGRALGRESLDSLLLRCAAEAGVAIFQPWTARSLCREGDEYVCQISGADRESELRAPVIIAAHGYWEPGTLPTQPRASGAFDSDLLAFKAHFLDSKLSEGLMPLLAFPGGYGGMVHSDAGRVSLSCCVRRARLGELRTRHEDAGDAVLRHILASCRGVRQALDGAKLDGPWLAAGPLRPGIRVCANGGIYLVGNAAGEAHPVIAEGISMAMQSAWLLTKRLVVLKPQTLVERHSVGNQYASDWRRSFAPRLRAAAVFAHWAMRPLAVAATGPFLRSLPAILSIGARLSGKASRVVA